MSESAIDPTQKRCDVCGIPFKEDSGSGIRVLELAYHVIEDLRKLDEDLADELLANDGRLAYHADCRHQIHQYLPERNEPVLASDAGSDSPTADLQRCPVCTIAVSKSVEQCGRCGAELA